MKKKRSTRSLLNLKTIKDYTLQGNNGIEKVFYLVEPTNLSVMSEESVSGKVFALTNVLKGIAQVEILCLNSKDNFEQNKSFLRSRYEQESNDTVKKLLKMDLLHLDKIQIQTATARLFLLIVSVKEDQQKEMHSLLNRIEKLLKMQNFTVHRANKDDIKNMLGVYLEQNVTTDHYEDVDGERWYEDSEIEVV